MIQRCTNPSRDSYQWYGARGVTVCEEWTASFRAFLTDVGVAPSPKHSIDRIDSEGHYAPGNVRWSTQTEQQRNRRNNRRVTFRGETMCLAEWAERLGVQANTLGSRLNMGWSVEEAMTAPKSRYHAPLTANDVAVICRLVLDEGRSRSAVGRMLGLSTSGVCKVIKREIANRSVKG